MNRLTLNSVKSTIARVLGTCTTDSRIASYVNEAQERLMSKGRWVGTVVRYRICTSESCLVWPRQIETIEAWALCDTPMIVRDRWYEFVQSGPGLRRHDLGCPNTLVDRGTAVSFDTIAGASSKLNVVSDVTESGSARILLQGYDENAQWIRTQDGGSWIDGEYVSIAAAGNRTTKKFTKLTGVIKPVTNGPVRLFEWPTATGANLKEIAYYESDETIPIYRVSLVPNMDEAGRCPTAASDCTGKTVTVLAKLRHIPVSNDNDFLVLGNLAAIKLMVQAILKEERNIWDEAEVYEQKAVRELENELSSYEGDGVVPVLRVASPDIFGAGSVENIVSFRR